jgi:Tfp pilus assembly protein PilX
MIEKLFNEKKGSVLTVVIVVMAVIIIFSVSLLSIQGSEIKIRKMTEDRVKARYVAEAGLEATISAITKALEQGLNTTPGSTSDVVVSVNVNTTTMNGNKYVITKNKLGVPLDNVVFKVDSVRNANGTYSYFIRSDQGTKAFEVYSLGQLYSSTGTLIRAYGISATITYNMDISNKMIENYAITKWEEEK